MISRRNTIQKDLIRNAVYEMRRHVIAYEVYEFIYDISFTGICPKCREKVKEEKYG